MISIEQRPEISSINRHDQRYSQQINWEYIGTDRMRRKFINDIMEGIELPYGYTAEDMSGQQITEEEEEELKQTLWLTLVFIFMALAAMFESFALPFLVLLSIPMALVGRGRHLLGHRRRVRLLGQDRPDPACSASWSTTPSC